MAVKEAPGQAATASGAPHTPPTARELRDRARGYTINRGYVAIAYAGEVMLIAASLTGAWLFAQQYGDGTNNTLIMMMLAPISYAVVEMCRVPMAMAFRTQTNMLLKIVLFIGLVCAAGVTVKSLSQLGEQMFHPRLRQVIDAHEALQIVERERDTFEKRLAEARERVDQRQKAVDVENGLEREQRDHLGKLEAQKCGQVSGVNGRGNRYTVQRCSPNPLIPIITASLEAASARRLSADRELEQARAARDALSREGIDARVSAARTAHRNAVRESQLHSFTAMVFRKPPTEVTDGEIHAFLFLFVFFPAIFASVAATLLAIGAVTRIRQPDPPVALADQAGAYMLGPLAEHIIRQTTESVHKAAQADVAEASARVSGARIKAVT